MNPGNFRRRLKIGLALLAPAGTPHEVLARLRSEVAQALTSPSLLKRFSERGVELLVSGSPEEFSAFIRDEAARYAKLVREAHIKPE